MYIYIYVYIHLYIYVRAYIHATDPTIARFAVPPPLPKKNLQKGSCTGKPSSVTHV